MKNLLLILKNQRTYVLGLIILLIACDSGDIGDPGGGGTGQIPPPPMNQDWLIPVDRIFDITGRDAIPALSNPELIEAEEASYMFDPELVIGYYDGNTALAIPHHIVDWHEIVNHDLLVFTYCPLTGTAIAWPQALDGFESEFGVSGLLYNNNLIAFDRNTGSNWSQVSLKAVNGPMIGMELPTFQLVETRWSTWKEFFPETKVVSRNTGIDRPYGTYPYNDFRTNHDNLIVPLTTDDRRLPRKERVHGVIVDGQAKVYRFDSFRDGNELNHDIFNGQEIIVVGNIRANFIVTFLSELGDGSKPNFNPLDEGNVIIGDDQGNKWNIFGHHIEGPTDENLIPTQSFMGYWFAFGAFYPTPEIYEF